MRKWQRRNTRLATIAVIVLLGVLALVSYELTAIAIVFFAGLVLCCVGLVISGLGVVMGKTSWGMLIITFGTSILMFILLFTVVLPALRAKSFTIEIAAPATSPQILEILEYELTLSRIPGKGFRVQHQIAALTPNGPDTLQVGGGTIQSSNLGLFVKGVVIDLTCNPANEPVAQRAQSAEDLRELPCPDTVHVELLDMPADMFYQARGVSSVEKTTFVDTETIEWSIPGDQRSITFAYLAPPAHLVKPFFPDSAWTHSGVRLIIIGIFLLTSAIILPVSVSVAGDLAKRLVEKRKSSQASP